jgi:hypothetical protein
MQKEPYITPEVTSETVAPGALATVGSPVINEDCPGGCGCCDDGGSIL